MIGQHIGAYCITGEIGSGGMGAVYRAEDRRSGRTGALKILKEPLYERKAVERFLREGEILRKLERHPGGPDQIDGLRPGQRSGSFHDRGTQGCRIFLIGTYRPEDLMEGGPLSQRIRSMSDEELCETLELRGLPPEEVSQMAQEMFRVMVDQHIQTFTRLRQFLL